MGNATYNASDRTIRAVKSGFTTISNATMDTVFEQNRKREIHKDMDPKGIKFRESRDSEAHPNTIPIQFYLDVTGSMGAIPREMIRDGLPTLMSTLIQNGVADAALLFGAIGDHEEDYYPFQVAQFESGDEELDKWLTRTYLEGGGGGNAGESYPLAWYFAANHVKTDAWDKRGKKGFVITVGDEPYLRDYPIYSLKELMGDVEGEKGFSAEELLTAAQAKNHVFHIHVNHGRKCDPKWKQLLGDNLIEIDDARNVGRVVSDLVLANTDKTSTKPQENLL